MKVLLSLLSLLLLPLLPSLSLAANPNNITAILASHPEFSTFSSLCTQTGVASQIYSRSTVTVLAVPNATLDPIVQGSTLSASTLYEIISYHVLLDYFDIPKFEAIVNHTELSATLLQASGQVTGNTGYLNITVQGSTIRLGSASTGLLTSTVVSELYSSPYNISVVSITSPLLPAGVVLAPGPSAAPVNFTAILMQSNNYTIFLSLIKATGVDAVILKHDQPPGVTIFAPNDAAFKKLPSGLLGNLTSAQQTALLEFHCLPNFFSTQELGALTTPQLTLASGTTGATYEYKSISLTKAGATVINTGYNTVPVGPTLYSQEPLGLYGIATVLMPTDLFGQPPVAAPAMTPSPTPSVSPAPGPSTAKSPSAHSPPAPPSSKNNSSSSDKSMAPASLLQAPAGGILGTLFLLCGLSLAFL